MLVQMEPCLTSIFQACKLQRDDKDDSSENMSDPLLFALAGPNRAKVVELT